MSSVNAYTLVSRYSYLGKSYVPYNVKFCYTVALYPQRSYVRYQFLVHFAENKLYLRCLYDAEHTKQLIESYAIIHTPLATKDFKIEFHAEIIDQIRIVSVQMSPLGPRQSMFVLLTNEVDFYLYRIPLIYFKYEISGNEEITRFSVDLKSNELTSLTRSIDNYKDVSLVKPINHDYLVGYNKKAAYLCLINYSDSMQQTQKFKHANQAFYKLLDPSTILVDTRGPYISKSAGNIQGVYYGKNTIILVYYQYCAIELWEYFIPRQGGLSCRENAPSSTITSLFSYLKAIYPQHLIPIGYNNDHSQSVVSVYYINYRSQKSGEEQFLFIVGMHFRGEKNIDYKARADRQMDQSLINNVPDYVFIENNIFLYTPKKFLCATSVDYEPEIISLSYCYKYVFVASTYRNVVTSFRIDYEKGVFVLSTSKSIVHPNKGARLTQVVSTPKWLCLLDAEDQVYSYNDTNTNEAQVNLYCIENYGMLRLPKSNSYQETRASMMNTTDLNKSLNKSVHFNDEVGRRKVMTRIPNLENFMNTSLFSPRAENYVRRYTYTYFAPRKIETFYTMADSSHLRDDNISVYQIKELQEKFMQYYNIYERLRIIEEFLLLCINVEIDEKSIYHLNEDLVVYVKSHYDNVRISYNNANFDFGSTEFLYNEIQFVNPKLIDLLSPIRNECALDFSMIDSIKTLFTTRSLPTKYLEQLHYILDTYLNFVSVSEAYICDILQQELLEEEENRGKSLVELLTGKISDMMEYFYKCALHYQGGFAAVYQAISSRHSSLQDQSQDYTIDQTLDINEIEVKSPYELSAKIAKYAKHSDNVLRNSEKTLLRDQYLISYLPRMSEGQTAYSTTIQEIDLSHSKKEDFDYANLQNIYQVYQYYNVIISQDDYRFIKYTLAEGEAVDEVQQYLYVLTDNDKNSKADEIRIREVYVRGQDDPDDDNYIVEKEEVEYYEETITDESVQSNDDSMDLELNEAYINSKNAYIWLPERQIPLNPVSSGIKIITENVLERGNIYQQEPAELEIYSLERYALPREQQSNIYSTISNPDGTYSEETKKLVATYAKIELDKSVALQTSIHGNSKIAQDSAVEKLAINIQRYALIKKLKLTTAYFDEILRIVLRIPTKKSSALLDKMYSASRLKSSLTEDVLDSAALTFESGQNVSSPASKAKAKDSARINEKKTTEKATPTKGETYKQARTPDSQLGKRMEAKKPKKETLGKKQDASIQETEAVDYGKKDYASDNKNAELNRLGKDIAHYPEYRYNEDGKTAAYNVEEQQVIVYTNNIYQVKSYDAKNNRISLYDVDYPLASVEEQGSTAEEVLADQQAIKSLANDQEHLQIQPGTIESGSITSSVWNVEPQIYQKGVLSNIFGLFKRKSYEELNYDINSAETTSENARGKEADAITELISKNPTYEVNLEGGEHEEAGRPYEFIDKRISSEHEVSNQENTATKYKEVKDVAEEVLEHNSVKVQARDACKISMQYGSTSDVSLIECERNIAANDVQFSKTVLEAEVYATSPLEYNSLTINSSLQLREPSDAFLPGGNEHAVRLQEYSNVVNAKAFYPYSYRQLLSPGLSDKILFSVSPYESSLASAMLNSADASMFDCHLDREALLKDLREQDNLERLIDGLIRLYENGNHFFETAFIHQKRYAHFRQHVLEIRQGKIPRNEIIAGCFGQRSTQWK